MQIFCGSKVAISPSFVGVSLLLLLHVPLLRRFACSMQVFCGSKSAISPSFESKSATSPPSCLFSAGLCANVLTVDDTEALCA